MVHNKQWIWDEEPHLVDETWTSVRTANGRYISYQQNLPIRISENGRVALLGWAWQTDASHESPEKELDELAQREDFDKLYELESTWFGRYVVLYHDYVWMDAVGSMGCYYDSKRVSGSLALLWELSENRSEKKTIPHADIHLGPADYTPGPRTPIENIKRLMVSEVYNVKTSETRYRHLLKQSFGDMTDEELLNQFSECAIYGLQQMAKSGRRICSTITGGKDSRAGVALLEAAGVEYTGWMHVMSVSAEADAAVARKIAKTLHKPITIMEKQEEDNERVDEWNRHCAYLSRTRWVYTQHLHTKLTQREEIYDVICPIFELIQDWYAYNITPEEYQRIYTSYGAYYEKAFMEWLELVKNDPLNKQLTLTSRMYWELRCGCFMSANCQGWDIVEHVTNIPILNCRRYFELLLRMDEKYRRNREWEIILTNKLCPELAKIPYASEYVNGKILMRRTFSKMVSLMKRNTPTKLYTTVRSIYRKCK